ncbi:MAG: tannase/feruloyl esterase family alpha/beta hydrolase [Acidobacteriota bacterium]
MNSNAGPCRWASVTLFVLGVASGSARLGAQVASVDPAKMRRIGTVDERFQSYNIEMVEVIGGRFWKPFTANNANTSKAQPPAQQSGSTPAGMDPDLYQYRPPIDLTNPRLLKLAAELGPAYVRVSGTWANAVYFHDFDSPAPPNAPSGFSGVLTRKEWKGVIDFSHAVSAETVTSFATSPGPRDPQGVWKPEQARQLLAYTKSVGGRIAAAEFMNEPTYAAMGGAPKGYAANAYGRDIVVFRPFVKQTAPDMVFLGPGSVGEGPLAMPLGGGMLKTEDLLKATGPVFDVFSYHLYAAASKRCANMGAALQTTAAAAVSQDWLSRPEKIGAFYAGLRDTFQPGKPLWITETADAACNGNTLRLDSSGDVPLLTGQPTRAGRVSFAPVSITFLAIANANNKTNCLTQHQVDTLTAWLSAAKDEQGRVVSFGYAISDIYSNAKPGANLFAWAEAPGPNFFDALSALERWVENGVPPETMTATKYTNDDPTQSGLRTMPLCTFPTQAHYSGHGNVNDAENWSCAANQDLLRVGRDGALAGLVGLERTQGTPEAVRRKGTKPLKPEPERRWP